MGKFDYLIFVHGRRPLNIGKFWILLTVERYNMCAKCLDIYLVVWVWNLSAEFLNELRIYKELDAFMVGK